MERGFECTVTSRQLIEENIPLVYYIVSHEYPTYIGDEDIIQSGMVGLCRAAEGWDEARGSFANYAGKWIRGEIKQEFIRRKPYSKNISLETNIGEDGTLADVIAGDEDVAFIDDENFFKTLTPEELEVLRIDSMGYSADEIAELCGLSTQKVWKLLRIIQHKWRKFNGE